MKRLLLIVLFITGIANAQTTYLQVGNTLQQKDTTINAVSQKTYRTVKGSTGYEYFPTRGWVLAREWAISRVTGLQDALDGKQPVGNYLPLEAGQFNKLTGGLYMNNNLYIYVRNAANTDNLRLFGLSDTDQLWLDPDGIGVNFGWNANFNGPISGSSAGFSGNVTAPQFIGNASTATLAANSTLWNGYDNVFGFGSKTSGITQGIVARDENGSFYTYSKGAVQSWLDLGSAAYKNSSSGHNSSNTLVERDVSGKGGLEDLYLGSGYNDWLSTILTGKASTASLDNYLLKTGGTLTGGLIGTTATFGVNGRVFIREPAGDAEIGGTSGASLKLFADNIEYAKLSPSTGFSTTLSFSAPSLTSSSLTPGRVPYIGTAGLIQDDADLTFDGSNLTVGGKGTFSASRSLETTGNDVLFANSTGAHNIIFGDNNVRYYSLYTPSGAATGSIRNFSTSTDIIRWGASGGVEVLTDLTGTTGNFSSTVTVADATASGHAVNKGQLDAKVQNNLTASTTIAPSATAVNTALDAKANLSGSNTFTGFTEVSELFISGKAQFKFTNVSSTPYALGDGYTFLVSAVGSNITVNLPPANAGNHRIVVIKKVDSSANTVIIDGDGSETIDGALTKVLSTQYSGVTIQSDNFKWHIIGTF